MSFVTLLGKTSIPIVQSVDVSLLITLENGPGASTSQSKGLVEINGRFSPVDVQLSNFVYDRIMGILNENLREHGLLQTDSVADISGNVENAVINRR